MISYFFDFIKFLGERRRPCLANILYSICAMIAIMFFIYQIFPYDFRIPFDFSGSIRYILTDRSALPHVTFVMYALYFLSYILSRVIYQVSLNLAPLKALRVYTTSLAIMYVLELFLAILSTALILASILQFHHTSIFYDSVRAWGVYLFVGIKFILFLFDRQQIQQRILEQRVLHSQSNHNSPD